MSGAIEEEAAVDRTRDRSSGRFGGPGPTRLAPHRGRRIIRLALAALAMPVASIAAAQAPCGEPMGECRVASGTYHVSLPDPPARGGAGTDRGPALLFFHGAGRSGAQTMRDRAFVRQFNRRGYAVISPNGLARPGSRFGPGWSFLPGRARQRDELAFAREVLADASARFSIDRERILVGGFSVGGSLVWYLACEDRGLGRAYAPVSGAFWRTRDGAIPGARDCSGPVDMFHTHGWRDETVPLEGRPLGDASILQGDVFASLAVLREVNGCAGLKADRFSGDGRFLQRWWTACESGAALRFALHPGAHEVPPGWAGMAIDWFASLPARSSPERQGGRGGGGEE